ncbi:MAG: 3-deoxy-manno-octulosonate cytidylyltransferase [Proteobacteria bacterium]|nr:3-deoxy-manno-octulosonate cytidylyltransferase [Pseudomonadota bacterium]
MKNKVLTIIPVRLASTRLPNKPLADICGKSMIQRVYEQALAANLGEVLIACDGEEIAAEVKKFGGKFVITDPNLPSGTDRIYAAYKKFHGDGFDVILNLQGDLPNIDPQVIRAAAKAALEHDCDIATVASKIENIAEITNPNVVKIAISFIEETLGKALYFSRAPIPFSKTTALDFYHHIGIYAYKKSALEKFVSLSPSNLEQRESLEQLRALENDMKILVKIVQAHPLSVDTQEDLAIMTKLVSAQ